MAHIRTTRHGARPEASAAPALSLRWPTLLLGVALGGFFDGILLHQILQWHHLLSGLEAAQSLRLQLIADGLFHALMYLVGSASLIALFRRRAGLLRPGAGARLWGRTLQGFGIWHVADAAFSHWLLGIHRIRMDVANPFAWDLAWLVVFGLLPLLLGGWISGGSSGRGRGRPAAIGLALAVSLAGWWAARPAPGMEQTLVMFAPGVAPGAAHHALAEQDARVIWVDRSGAVWAVAMPASASRWRLHRQGALMVSNSAVAMGCLSWARAGPRT